MSVKCLMIETKEKKRLFTLIKNKGQLAEYCRTFGAKMMVVQADLDRKSILDLGRLVPALCDNNYKPQKTKFTVLKKLTICSAK